MATLLQPRLTGFDDVYFPIGTQRLNLVDRIKVFVLIKGLGLGGAEKLLALSLPHINRDRFDYAFGYLLPWKNALVPDFHKAEIPVVCLNQRRVYDVGVFPRLVRLLRQREVDILHLHLPYAGILGRVAGKLANVKSIAYTEHSLWEHHHRVTRWANRLTYQWNDSIICVSEAVRQSVLNHGQLKRNVTVGTIHNGVDLADIRSSCRNVDSVRQEFGIPPVHKLIVHVANFNPQKRHQDLLAAAQLVLSQDPNVTFLLVGHGRLEHLTKTAARDMGIAGNIIFAGFRTDAPRLMAAADLFVLPSEFEGLPLSLLEAMGLGKPVVASRTGGIPEVVTDGVEGFLTDPLNPSQLAHKILVLLSDPEMRRRFSENALKRIQEQFTVRRMVQSTEAVYDKLLGEERVV